jgi:hypothetical protein
MNIQCDELESFFFLRREKKRAETLLLLQLDFSFPNEKILNFMLSLTSSFYLCVKNEWHACM